MDSRGDPGQYTRRKKTYDDLIEVVYAYIAVGNAIDPHTGQASPIPDEFLVYRLTQLYHCTPDDVRQLDYEEAMLHLRFRSMEREIAAQAGAG